MSGFSAGIRVVCKWAYLFALLRNLNRSFSFWNAVQSTEIARSILARLQNCPVKLKKEYTVAIQYNCILFQKTYILLLRFVKQNTFTGYISRIYITIFVGCNKAKCILCLTNIPLHCIWKKLIIWQGKGSEFQCIVTLSSLHALSV